MRQQLLCIPDSTGAHQPQTLPQNASCREDEKLKYFVKTADFFQHHGGSCGRRERRYLDRYANFVRYVETIRNCPIVEMSFFLGDRLSIDGNKRYG
jgi:hypothetical protein